MAIATTTLESAVSVMRTPGGAVVARRGAPAVSPRQRITKHRVFRSFF